MEIIYIQKENSSYPESCRNEICSATSPEEMTSVRTCYCKQEGNVSRKKDGIADRDRQPPISKRLVIKNKACRSNRESPMRERSDEKMPKNRSVEVQSDPILSPETSTALENAEKIINNAKIQLMEVCAMSSLDSVRRNKNTCSDPPLDDETEELLYIRELVASKFYETSSSRSETNERTTSAPSENRSPRVTVRRVDLSAPKFRMSRRRRRADWYLEYGSDDRSRERASPTGAPSRDDDSSSSSKEDSNEATTRDDRPRNLPGRASSSAVERELVRARENACEIQIGPSVHIVDRELTRQDLEDLHISPDSSWCRTNTATYVLRHSGAAKSPVTFADNEPRKISGATRKKTVRVRLDTLQREEPTVPETEATSVSEKGDIGDSERGRIESLKSQVRNCIDGEEKKKETNRDTKISECLEKVTNQEAINPVVMENSGADHERSQDKQQNENEVRITFRDETNSERGRIVSKNSDVDGQTYLRKEESVINEMAMKNQSDRSKPLSDNSETSRKTEFPRRGNIPARAYRAMENSRSQIDERFSNTFDSHNGQDELYDVTGKDIHRSFISNCKHDFPIKDIWNEVDLYRPRLNDLDTILLSNDRKIERVVHATETFGELLTRLEFATCRDEDEQTSRYVSPGEFHHESSADKVLKLSSNEPARSSIIETELKNADLTVSCVPSAIRVTDTNMRRTDTREMKSSGFTKESDSRSKYSKNSAESSVFPGSDTSYGSEIKSSRDKVQRPKTEAHLSESSSYKSDVTTFSNMVPAFSSTRTETQTYEEKQVTRDNRHADAGRLVEFVKRSSKREIDCSRKEYDHAFAHEVPRKDASEAADRFIAYLLQDEKQSIEGKVANALKESAMAPVAVQKLLDNLRNAKRETETLDILKNILINVQPDRETKESVPVADSGSIRNSRNNSELDTRRMESVDINAKINVDKSQTDEGIEDAKIFSGNVADSSRTIEESRVKDQSVEQIVEKSYDFNKSDELSSDSSACRGTREDAAPLRPLESAQGSKNNNSKGISYSEAESLKQISDIRSDDDALPCKNSPDPSKTVSAKSNERCTMEAEDPKVKIAESTENKEDDANNERRVGNESSGVQEAVKEIIIKETQDNIRSTNKSILPAKISEMKERINSDIKSIESIDETLKKGDVNLAHSPAKEDVEPLSATEEEIGSRHSVAKEKVDFVANSCSASLQDDASLSSAENSKSSLKEVVSHVKQSIIGEDDLIKNRKNDDKSMTIIAVDDRRNEIEDSGYLKNTKSNFEEQLNDSILQTHNVDILSNSNSSVSSILLDCDNRSTNGAFSANAKRIETSSETSHSEGELYMPSSCSYSLGEVRVLKKCELISNNSIDRDSSATILVTRSMLTSLNNSTISLLESSG